MTEGNKETNRCHLSFGPPIENEANHPNPDKSRQDSISSRLSFGNMLRPTRKVDAPIVIGVCDDSFGRKCNQENAPNNEDRAQRERRFLDGWQVLHLISRSETASE